MPSIREGILPLWQCIVQITSNQNQNRGLGVITMKRLLNDQSGVTAIEYALIASGIAMAIVLIVINVGSALHGIFVSVRSGLNTAS
jgi:pilus assembly protein Flp/PilA